MLEEDGNLALNDRRLDILVHDQRKAALWMKHHRLIASSPRCSVCSMLLKWVIQRNCADYFAWKCINIECEQFKMLHFIRSNSIFDDMRLSLGSYIEAMRLWSAGIVIRRAAKRSGIPNASLTSAYRRFRDVCVNYIERNSLQLGGVKSDCQAHIIQIITKFHIKQSWEAFKFHVLIIVDLNSKPQVFHLEAIEDLSPESIMLVIRKIVMRGTRISCGQSVPIQALIEHNAQTHRALMLESDGIASDEFHFCGAEFTNIGKVNAMKSLLWKLRCGLLASYRLCGLASCEGAAAEYLWTYRFSDNPFANLCQHITKYCSF
uniref:HTH CENPB-type domain-containing protein n=1 Tax=Ascaris lumbricoides TaxID=6252 RepID=A0A0M3I9I0_ASCLU